MSDYNSIAPVYDRLARFIFGDQLNVAVKEHLISSELELRILILGGGSGSLLEDLAVLSPAAKITYVDSSVEMIKMAQKRQSKNLHIDYVTKSIFTTEYTGTYDVVIVPFVLDMFNTIEIFELLNKLKPHMRSGTQLLFTDFVGNQKLFHKLLISVMYLFFRVTTGCMNTSIPDYDGPLRQQGFVIEEESYYMSRLVVARKYRLI